MLPFRLVSATERTRVPIAHSEDLDSDLVASLKGKKKEIAGLNKQ